MTPKRDRNERRNEYVIAPFVVAIDGREKAPYRFTGLLADASQKNRPLIIPTERKYLKTGDYSIVGLEELVSVERKSIEDLFSTLGSHRDRFKAEHERLAKMAYKAVVIECAFEDIVLWPPERSKLNPKTVYRTAISWIQDYEVLWWFCGHRRLAEVTTYRFLEKAWRKIHRGKAEGKAGESGKTGGSERRG